MSLINILISYISDFISCNFKFFFGELQEKKKSELGDLKSQLKLFFNILWKKQIT